MPTTRGAEPPPVPDWPPPVKGENELPPPAGGARGGAGCCCGVPSEGWYSRVPAAEGSVRLPVRVPKTSAVALATLAAALWTVPTALAAVVPTLDGRRNAPPTEAGTVGTGVEGVKPVTAVGLRGVRGGSPCLHGTAGSATTSPLTSPASPEAAGSTCSEAAAGPGTGTSTGSGAGPDAYPSPAAAAGATGAGDGSMTSGESFGIGWGASTRPKSDAE